MRALLFIILLGINTIYSQVKTFAITIFTTDSTYEITDPTYSIDYIQVNMGIYNQFYSGSYGQSCYEYDSNMNYNMPDIQHLITRVDSMAIDGYSSIYLHPDNSAEFGDEYYVPIRILFNYCLKYH